MTRPSDVRYKSWRAATARDQTPYAPPAFEICHTPLPAILPLANGLTKTCGVPDAPDVYANQWPSGEILPPGPPILADVLSKGSGGPALGWSGSVVSMVRLCGPPPGPPIRTNRPSGGMEVAICPR